MTFFGFNAEYVDGLTTGDAEVERHFTAYFGELLYLKLRSQLRSYNLIEDVRQETLLRVLRALRVGSGIEHPERLGAFVLAVSKNVLYEMLRSESRHSPWNENAAEPVDSRVDLDAPLIDQERKEQVADVLAALSEKDRALLRMVFLEERDKDEVCRLLAVDGDYLRVLLHRAKSRFRSVLAKQTASTVRRGG
jgi:RNA polymerase sigma-70 factor (ECF subfamily)